MRDDPLAARLVAAPVITAPLTASALFVYSVCPCSRAEEVQEGVDEEEGEPGFHLDLWLCFTFQNWLLDVGRPVATVTVKNR